MVLFPPLKASRARSLVWLVIGVLLAMMYVVNGVQQSQSGYFVAAAGWVLLGASQAWRSRFDLPLPEGSDTEAARKSCQLALYASVLGLIVVLAGIAMRWA